MAPKRVLLTGGTGFIGRFVVAEFLRRGYALTLLVRGEAALRAQPWSSEVEVCFGDLATIEFTNAEVSDAGLVHLAWDKLDNFRALAHFENLLPLHYAFIKSLVTQGVSRALCLGTCLEYGKVTGLLEPERATQPELAYAVAKDALHKQLRALRGGLSFDLLWARLFYVFGPGQAPRALLSQLDAAIDRGDEVFPMSGGEQLRDYLPVQEVARQIVQLYESADDGSFNICSGRPISVRRLVEDRIAERAASIRPSLGHYPYPDYETMAFWGRPSVEPH